MTDAGRLDKIRNLLGSGRASWFRAPGRVNLMGDHTDYNDGFVLPLAIGLDCIIASVRTQTGKVSVKSIEFDEEVSVAADGSEDPSSVAPQWGRYVAGVVSVLAKKGRSPTGIEAVLSSTVPAGSGLSSSAALEVSVALALLDAAGLQMPKLDIALACRQAEQIATGVPCGIMDQLASLLGKKSHALLIDCRSLAVKTVSTPSEIGIVAIHSGLQRALAYSKYAERRRACVRAAETLGLTALRDAELEQVSNDPRARHVVTENSRVHRTARALESGKLNRVGRLFLESHQSLKEDFEVSTPELDALVDALLDAGASGARLTGAGFGGCVVGVAPENQIKEIATRAADSYKKSTGVEPTIYPVSAVDGAGPLPREK